jgi:murein DD-endopeptidase MepM/ murein hydrolase activator NlpD
MKFIATLPILASSNLTSIPDRVPNTNSTSAKKIRVMRRFFWAILLALCLATLAHQPALAQDEPRSYTVVAGDTLFEIAQSFGITLEELVAYNGITDPNLLEVGQVLLIPTPGASPGATSGATTGAESDPAATLPVADLATVRARPGDTVAAIAARYGQVVEQFAALNEIDPAARLFPGQPFVIPRASVGEEPLRFGAVRSVTVPPQLIQGRTGSVIVETSAPRELGGDWNGLPITFIPLPDAPNRYFAYLPVPALIAPNAYWLTVAYTASNGTALSQSWPLSVVEGPYDSAEINLPDDRGGLLAQDIVVPELEKVSAVWSQRTPMLYWTEVFSRPISPEYPTTSPFGTRRSYNGGPYASYHEGQDFGVPAGVPVLAPGAAVVALAEELNVRGTAVILDHGGGVFSGYWHLSELRVSVGQSVAVGDVIGISGNTGLSTGAHLHWELRIYGIGVDPMQFIDTPLLAP